MNDESRVKFAAELSGTDKQRVYRIEIDKQFFDVTNPTPTGRDLLTLAGKLPPTSYGLYLRIRGGQSQRIQLDQEVDLRSPGVDRFVTLPLDQTEG